MMEMATIITLVNTEGRWMLYDKVMKRYIIPAGNDSFFDILSEQKPALTLLITKSKPPDDRRCYHGKFTFERYLKNPARGVFSVTEEGEIGKAFTIILNYRFMCLVKDVYKSFFWRVYYIP